MAFNGVLTPPPPPQKKTKHFNGFSKKRAHFQKTEGADALQPCLLTPDSLPFTYKTTQGGKFRLN